MSKLRKKRKALMFVTFIGFALIIRAIVDVFMREPINIERTAAGVVIVLVSVYFSRRLMQNNDQ
ncbi:hypothetical protein JYT96_01525 [Gammaproteobacteria bacterium AH-315-C21]|nr:hypothetical protein [Gammaproteobacteria bacterium]MBN4078666.1 hypothetical protein [Gammaproteobacteria bacterium AH-315-C21]